MRFHHLKRSGVFLSILIWTLIYLANYVRRSFWELPDAVPVAGVITFYLLGLLVIFLVKWMIQLTQTSGQPWLYSLLLNLLLLFSFSYGIQFIQSKFHNVNAENQDLNSRTEHRIVSENRITKEITANISKGHSKINYDVFWMYLVILGIVYPIELLTRLKDQRIRYFELQNKFSTAQLNTLRAQLNPHFMFNALNTVSSLMEVDKKQAQQVLEDFSFLLRDIVDNSTAGYVSLEEELTFINRYVSIEKKRFHKNLQVNYTISEAAKQSHIPSMILQPLVENAIKHGVLSSDTNQDDSKGEISITATTEKSNLIVIIADNGPGVPDGGLKKGTGLMNTEERLKLLYAHSYRMRSIQVSMVDFRLAYKFLKQISHWNDPYSCTLSR